MFGVIRGRQPRTAIISGDCQFYIKSVNLCNVDLKLHYFDNDFVGTRRAFYLNWHDLYSVLCFYGFFDTLNTRPLILLFYLGKTTSLSFDRCLNVLYFFVYVLILYFYFRYGPQLSAACTRIENQFRFTSRQWFLGKAGELGVVAVGIALEELFDHPVFKAVE